MPQTNMGTKYKETTNENIFLRVNIILSITCFRDTQTGTKASCLLRQGAHTDLHFSAKLSRHIILLICDKPQKHTYHQYSDCNICFQSTQKSASSFQKSPTGSYVCCSVWFVLNLEIFIQTIIYNFTRT